MNVTYLGRYMEVVCPSTRYGLIHTPYHLGGIHSMQRRLHRDRHMGLVKKSRGSEDVRTEKRDVTPGAGGSSKEVILITYLDLTEYGVLCTFIEAGCKF